MSDRFQAILGTFESGGKESYESGPCRSSDWACLLCHLCFQQIVPLTFWGDCLILTPHFGTGGYVLNMNLSAPNMRDLDPPEGEYQFPGIGLNLKRVQFWTARVGLEATMGGRYALGVVYEKAIPFQICARTSPDPNFESEEDTPGRSISWRDSSPDWWTLDAAASYSLPAQYTLLAGLRVDHFLLKPRSLGTAGYHPEPDETIGGYSADFYQKLVVPYLGFESGAANWRLRLLGSPLVIGKVRTVFRKTEAELREQEIEVHGFSFYRTQPVFLEGYFDWRIPFSDTCMISLWVKGSWVRTAGKTTRAQAELEPDEPESGSARGYSVFTRGIVGGGVGAYISF